MATVEKTEAVEVGKKVVEVEIERIYVDIPTYEKEEDERNQRY